MTVRRQLPLAFFFLSVAPLAGVTAVRAHRADAEAADDATMLVMRFGG